MDEHVEKSTPMINLLRTTIQYINTIGPQRFPAASMPTFKIIKIKSSLL